MENKSEYTYYSEGQESASKVGINFDEDSPQKPKRKHDSENRRGKTEKDVIPESAVQEADM